MPREKRSVLMVSRETGEGLAPAIGSGAAHAGAGPVTLVTCGGVWSHLQERYYAELFQHFIRHNNELQKHGLRPKNRVDAGFAFMVEEAVLHVIGKNQSSARQQLDKARNCAQVLRFSFLLFVSSFSLIAAGQAQSDRRVLRTIREVNQLSNIEARNAYPVQLEGTVTYSDPEWGLLFVEDPTGAIYVNVHGMSTSFPTGNRVKIEAVTGPGDVDTVLVNPHIEILGRGDLPAAEHRKLSDIGAQKADSRFVQTRGVLRAGDQPWKRICFRLFDGDISALVVVPQVGNAEARRLVGATVRVRGVSGVHIDQKGKVVGALIFVNRLEDIEVEGGAAPNPNTLAAIVNKSNPVNELSMAELRKILLGERTTWRGSRKIILLLPTVGSPERQTALRLIAMDESNYKQYWQDKAGSVAPAASASGFAVNLVADTEDAIAVVPLADVKGSVKLLRIDGTLPGESGYPIH